MNRKHKCISDRTTNEKVTKFRKEKKQEYKERAFVSEKRKARKKEIDNEGGLYKGDSITWCTYLFETEIT